MKKLLPLVSAIALSTNVMAGELGVQGTALDCDASTNTCQLSVPLKKDTVVSWYIVSQTSNTPGMKITSDVTGQLLVDTKVFSTDLSNKSTGDFVVPSNGSYTVVFSGVHSVQFDQATISADFKIATQTYQFAGEDGVDNDFNDIYGSITWFASKG